MLALLPVSLAFSSVAFEKWLPPIGCYSLHIKKNFKSYFGSKLAVELLLEPEETFHHCHHNLHL